MKLQSILQLAAVTAFSILAMNIAVTPRQTNDDARRDGNFLPAPQVAYNGDDNGCVPNPWKKQRPVPRVLGSGLPV